MTSRRLLMIAYYFPPLGMGGVQRPLKFAKYLPDCGWDVTVITQNHSGYHAVDESLNDEVPERVQVHRVYAIDPASLVRSRVAQSDSGQTDAASPGFMRQVQQWARWPDDKVHFGRLAARRGMELAESTQFDAIYTTSPPPSIHFAGLSLQDKLGIPWVADFRDPWLVRSDDWGPTPLHRGYAQKLRARILKRSDHVIAMNSMVAEEFRSADSGAAISIIPNGYDEADFADAPDHKDENALTISFYGTISNASEVRPFLDTAGTWREVNAHCSLKVKHIGLFRIPADGLSSYGEFFESVGYRPHRKAVQELCTADAIVLSLPHDEGYKSTIPGRVYELLRTCLPILAYAQEHSALSSLLETVDGVWLCDPNDPSSTMSALDEISKLDRRATVRSVDSIRQFDRRRQTATFARILDGMVVGSRGGPS